MDTRMKHLLPIRLGVQTEQSMRANRFVCAVCAIVCLVICLAAATPLFLPISTDTGRGFEMWPLCVMAITFGLTYILARESFAWNHDLRYQYKEVTRGVLQSVYFISSDETYRHFFNRPKTLYMITLSGLNRAGEEVDHTKEVLEYQWKEVYQHKIGEWFDFTKIPHE